MSPVKPESMAGVPTSESALPKLVVAGAKTVPSTLTSASCAVRDGRRHRVQALELEGVPVVGHDRALAQRELRRVAVGRGGDDADGQQHHAEVDDHAAVGPADQAAPPADMPGVRAPHREHEGASGRGRRHGPEAEADQRAEAPQPESHAEHDGADADPDRDGQPLPEDLAAHFAPAEHGGHRHEEEQHQAGRDGDRVEEGRADVDLLLGERLVEQRVERADEHDEGEADEDHVVQQERALPARAARRCRRASAGGRRARR